MYTYSATYVLMYVHMRHVHIYFTIATYIAKYKVAIYICTYIQIQYLHMYTVSVDGFRAGIGLPSYQHAIVHRSTVISMYIHTVIVMQL